MSTTDGGHYQDTLSTVRAGRPDAYTPYGERPIETLERGDLVVTRDNGVRPIRWIGSRTVPGIGRFAPVHFAPQALGGTSDRPLLVSPQHRMLCSGYRSQLLFGESEVLSPALHLVDGDLVTQNTVPAVTYIHLMFDEHEIIFAEGVASESFHPGDMAISALGDACREELFNYFPELRTDPGEHLRIARPCLKRHEGQLLSALGPVQFAQSKQLGERVYAS